MFILKKSFVSLHKNQYVKTKYKVRVPGSFKYPHYFVYNHKFVYLHLSTKRSSASYEKEMYILMKMKILDFEHQNFIIHQANLIHENENPGLHFL